jgi:preprotein translocase subunit SecF
MYKLTYLILILFLQITVSYSQSTEKFIDTGSVKNQFDYLVNTSSNYYQEQKIVKKQWLLKLQKNVQDSLLKNNNTLSIYKNNLQKQQSELDSIKNNIANLEELNTTLSEQQQQISFIGIAMDTSLFKTITYMLIVVFLTLFILYFIKFNQSNKITTESKLALKELEEAFNEHRSKALEREQKIMRKLQDELNKQKKDS